MQSEILLLGKRIFTDRSPLLLSYTPDERWLDLWEPKSGSWRREGGYLLGEERSNRGGILLSKASYETNVMFSFTIGAVPPATRDLNAVFCAEWDEKKNDLGNSYVCGLNGWYEHKSGIERNEGYGSNLYAATSLYRYRPGTEVRMTAGAIDGHAFLLVDGVLIAELIDPEPVKGGRIGFSAYCTKLKIKDIEVREICWEPYKQRYEPEF